jgi:hypothetical protein
MKKILYTVCSANHLAHCKTMVDSFKQYNGDYEIIIALVDQVKDRFSISEFKNYSLIEVQQLQIPAFDEICAKYSVIELNCAMKGFVAQFIFNAHQPDLLLYLDSDTWVFHSMEAVEKALIEADIIITPHFTHPYPADNCLPRERDMMRSGVYNAGFFALKKSDIAQQFLTWWTTHLNNECYYNFAEGMGVDQVWFNLVPLLFSKVLILQHDGANVAYWNLHERQISVNNGRVLVNDSLPLLFLHISGYSIDAPTILSKHQNRYDLAELIELKSLFEQYNSLVIQNGFHQFKDLECVYAVKKKKSMGLMKTANRFLKPLGIKITDL